MTFLQQTHQAHRERSIRLGRIPAPRRSEPEPVTPDPVEIAPAPVIVLHRSLPVRVIAGRVAERYGITFDEILSPRRSYRVMRPRQIAMYLARTIRKSSLPEIGRRFGGRDHTTVLNAIWRTEQRMAADPVVRAEVTALECELRAAMAKPVEAA